MDRDLATVASNAIRDLSAASATIATAESLTGGLLGAALTSVPGSSAVYRGGVVAYATELKASILGVDPDLLEDAGAVNADVAEQMALGAVRICRAEYGIGTTGVAGPDFQDGRVPGTVYICLADSRSGQTHGQHLELPGGREEIRKATCLAALNLLLTHLRV